MRVRRLPGAVFTEAFLSYSHRKMMLEGQVWNLTVRVEKSIKSPTLSGKEWGPEAKDRDIEVQYPKNIEFSNSPEPCGPTETAHIHLIRGWWTQLHCLKTTLKKPQLRQMHH